MSNYGKIKDLDGKTTSGYNPLDNANRKANRTSETFDNVGQNKAAHVYTTSGSSIQQTHDKNEYERQKIAKYCSFLTGVSHTKKQGILE